MIEPIEEEVIEHSKESLEHEEKDAEEEPQPTEVTVHALVGYSKPANDESWRPSQTTTDHCSHRHGQY